MRYLKTILFFIAFFFIVQAFAQTPDIILTHGKIFTSNRKQPYVEAVAVKGNKIMAVGNNTAIGKLAGTTTKKINLDGKTVVPGFNDAHYHHNPYYAGYTIPFPEDGSEPSWQQLKDSISSAVSQQPRGSFIYATMGVDVGTDTSINRHVLDQLAPDHPLLIGAYWGHVTYFNTAAIKALGISETEPDIKGGYLGRFPGTNQLNGRAYEHAGTWLQMKKPGNEALFLASLNDLGKQAVFFGVTSIQNMCTGATPGQFISMLKKQPLPIRFRTISWGEIGRDGKLVIPGASQKTIPNQSLVTRSGTKWLLDGTPIERLAWYSTEYKDQPGWKGGLDFSKQDVRRILAELSQRKDQPMFHVVGDSTIDFMLQELGKSPATWKNRRVRFEHGDGLLPASYGKAKNLGIIVVQNPSHFTIVPVLNQRYGTMLLQYAEPVKSLLNAGIPVALGSDGPLNPFLNIMFACMHPFRPSEALTVEEAVIAYTKTSAYAEMQDNKGMIAPGQLADLAVLSNDIFTMPLQQLPATHSVLTMVNGKIVYNTLQE
jgi:predicted amidohydrolase YtcJ